jgi:hypothetical protein
MRTSHLKNLSEREYQMRHEMEVFDYTLKTLQLSNMLVQAHTSSRKEPNVSGSKPSRQSLVEKAKNRHYHHRSHHCIVRGKTKHQTFQARQVFHLSHPAAPFKAPLNRSLRGMLRATSYPFFCFRSTLPVFEFLYVQDSSIQRFMPNATKIANKIRLWLDPSPSMAGSFSTRMITNTPISGLRLFGAKCFDRTNRKLFFEQ